MNGRWHSKHVIVILNMSWCLLARPMHLLFFNIWWMMCFVSTWMILWFATLMKFSIFQRTWQIMNTMYISCWRNFKKSELYAKLEKCEFHQSKMEFVGYIISGNGICMDPRKVQTILNWITLIFIRNVQCFLAFANVYWFFITHYFTIVDPFICLTQKDQPFSWELK